MRSAVAIVLGAVTLAASCDVERAAPRRARDAPATRDAIGDDGATAQFALPAPAPLASLHVKVHGVPADLPLIVGFDPRGVEHGGGPVGAFVRALPAGPGGTVEVDLPVPRAAHGELYALASQRGSGDFATTAPVHHGGGIVMVAADMIATGEVDRVELRMRPPHGAVARDTEDFSDWLETTRREWSDEPIACSGPRERALAFPDAPVPAIAGRARSVCVRLPRSYRDGSTRRHPVIYWLPRIGDRAYGGVTMRDLRSILDDTMRELGRDANVVFVDTRTPHGQSSLLGAWEGFVADRIVDEVDARFQTIARREARALVGHSAGGLGAVSLALARPDRFSIAAAVAPYALDVEAWLIDPATGRVRADWLAHMRVIHVVGGPSNLAQLAREASREGELVWPADLESGELDAEIWARWVAQSPIARLRTPTGTEAARSVWFHLTAGTEDRMGVLEPTRRFHEALARARVEHAWAPTDLTHAASYEHGWEALLGDVLDRLASR